MGGTIELREEPGKQKTRRCRTQELARSSARENEWQKKGHLLDSARIGVKSKITSTASPSCSKTAWNAAPANRLPYGRGLEQVNENASTSVWFWTIFSPSWDLAPPSL